MTDFNCVRVNADYEQMLFHGRPGPSSMNEALEFLALFLQDLPVKSSAQYSQEYLSFVQELTQRLPRITREGIARNWWGPLENISRERMMNSKLTSVRLAANEGWSSAVIMSPEEVRRLNPSSALIVKDPFGMSGRGVHLLWPGDKISFPRTVPSELIVEPYLNRKYDFSHFVFPDGKVICYENQIDERFQYRGSVFRSSDATDLEALGFYQEISQEEWLRFQSALEKVIAFYGDPAPFGYSVDSFVYEQDGELRIYPLAEVNYRRTMGSCAFELSKLLSPGKASAISLKSPFFPNATKLSPSGVRFEIFHSFQ